MILCYDYSAKKFQCVLKKSAMCLSLLDVAKRTRTGVYNYTVLDMSFNLRCEISVNDFRYQPVLHEAYQ